MKKLISVIIASVKLTSFSQNMVSFFLTGSCNAVLPNCLLQCQTFYCWFYHILFFRIPATYRRIESQREKHRNLRWNIGSASAGIQASASILFWNQSNFFVPHWEAIAIYLRGQSCNQIGLILPCAIYLGTNLVTKLDWFFPALFT